MNWTNQWFIVREKKVVDAFELVFIRREMVGVLENQ